VTGKRVREARSGLSGVDFPMEEGRRVLIPELAIHDVVLLDS
jgi:hypothetical protein